jgi:hypothetical protein
MWLSRRRQEVVQFCLISLGEWQLDKFLLALFFILSLYTLLLMRRRPQNQISNPQRQRLPARYNHARNGWPQTW